MPRLQPIAFVGRAEHIEQQLRLSYSSDSDPSIIVRKYQHKAWKLSYLYKPASPGNESQPPIILVHPVGVGLSSWFWINVMKEYGKDGNPAIYAIDLIGCGLEHGADGWYPDKEGMFFPLSWVEGIETLIHTIVLPDLSSNTKIQFSQGCTVVVQGGLASVGILLCARNPTTVISNLVLTSPPIYDDLVIPIANDELEKNYKFLTSPIWGNIAFSILEQRSIIEFFSNLFLFESKCDDDWLDYAMHGASFEQSRTPVQAFNAGLLQARSFDEELTSMEQAVLVISGSGDKRTSKRTGYCENITNCRLEQLNGLNVLPWENEHDLVKLLREL